MTRRPHIRAVTDAFCDCPAGDTAAPDTESLSHASSSLLVRHHRPGYGNFVRSDLFIKPVASKGTRFEVHPQ